MSPNLTYTRTLHGHRILRAYTTNKGNLCLEVLICTVPLLDFNETLDEFYYAFKLKGHYFHSSHSNSFLCKRTRWRIEFLWILSGVENKLISSASSTSYYRPTVTKNTCEMTSSPGYIYALAQNTVGSNSL